MSGARLMDPLYWIPLISSHGSEALQRLHGVADWRGPLPKLWHAGGVSDSMS